MALTTYAELQSSIADWLLRTDLDDVIPDFIRLAEARMHRDYRVRQTKRQDPFTVDAESEELPSDFVSPEALYLDGDNSRYGEIEIVDFGSLPRYQNLYEPSGVPRVAAVDEEGEKFFFAPVPDQSYDMVLAYLADFTDLSDQDTSNWVLTNHPDAYLYGALIQSAPYMRDDERIATWNTLYETTLEEIYRNRQTTQYGGALVRRVSQPIP